MIDFKFIQECEGYSLRGYVPDPDHSRSGVTVASGFDIGQRSADQLHDLFTESLAEKLEPYAGLKGVHAVNSLRVLPLTVTHEEALEINECAHGGSIERLISQWPKWSVPFNCLADECQTVVASVAFQYGNLSTATPIFWRQVTSAFWFDAVKNLRDFGDRYQTRRNKEADLLESRIKQKIF